jgi:hypothetical protein
LICFGKETIIDPKKIEIAQKYLQEKKMEWSEYMKQSHDPRRNRYMTDVLKQASGIYKNKDKVKNTRLEKTVMINVIEGSDESTEKYNKFLKNLLCFTKHYEFETIVYIIEKNVTKFESVAQDLTHFDKSIRVVSYPFELFWSLVANKTSTMYQGFGKGDYIGGSPSFKHFGSFVMLVKLILFSVDVCST